MYNILSPSGSHGLTILLCSDGQLRRGGPLPSPGLGRHPDVVDGVGIEVLQHHLRGVRPFQGLVVGKLLKSYGFTAALINIGPTVGV